MAFPQFYSIRTDIHSSAQVSDRILFAFMSTQSGVWMRPCPMCGEMLTKTDPDMPANCPACEWLWQGWLPQMDAQLWLD